MPVRLTIQLDGKNLTSFEPDEKIEDLINYLRASGKENVDRFKFVTDESLKVSESIKEDIPDIEYTIWSSSDFAEEDEQIPLVKIKLGDDGEYYAEAVGNTEFDKESYRTAQNSLNTTKGRALRDRLVRIDKSLNHSDPFHSVELARADIISGRGNKKKSIRDLLGEEEFNKVLSDVERQVDSSDAELKVTIDKISNLLEEELNKEDANWTKIDRLNALLDKASAEVDKREKQKKQANIEKGKTLHPYGVEFLANQVLTLNRDDLKAAATRKSVTKDTLIDMFEDMTGVDYNSNRILDQEQYSYLLDLLGKSTDKYKDTHQDPAENKYVQNLKTLTDQLIVKIGG